MGGATLTGLHSPRSFNPGCIAGRCIERKCSPCLTRQDLKQREEAHWAKTSRLMFTHLGVWFFFGFVIHMFVKPLNTITVPILNFPLGFYMAAQGSLIVFVVMLFLFAKTAGQDRPRIRLCRGRLRGNGHGYEIQAAPTFSTILGGSTASTREAFSPSSF